MGSPLQVVSCGKYATLVVPDFNLRSRFVRDQGKPGCLPAVTGVWTSARVIIGVAAVASPVGTASIR